MFFLINKTLGISSFGAIAHIRKKLGIKKIGHTGTLDPLATGLLLVATGNSTKLIPYIDKARKTYVFTVRMDGWTPSGDLDTPVHFIDSDILRNKWSLLTIESIEKIIKEYFTGTITQTPPAYSALRIDGKRAYDLVRAGKEVVIPERQVQIYSSRIVSYAFPDVTIEMEVSVGTYIRSIARDLGERLGLSGYVTVLHRNKIAHLDESSAKRFDEISLNDAISYDKIFTQFRIIAPGRDICEKLRNGLKFPNTMALESGRKYLVEENGKYISLIELRDGEVRICANNLE